MVKFKLKKKTHDFARLSRALTPRNRSGQEEIVGFVMIIVIVSVILLVLLWFLLRTPSTEGVQNYQVESFIQASLQYTSNCENEVEFLPIDDLIASCQREETCLDGTNSCEVLNSTLKDLIKNSWNVNNESSVKGYKLDILANEITIFELKEGSSTTNYKGALQDFAKSGENYEISMNVYY